LVYPSLSFYENLKYAHRQGENTILEVRTKTKNKISNTKQTPTYVIITT